MSENELFEKLYASLSVELSQTDDKFSPDLLEGKVRNAISEVKQLRKYPAWYSQDKIYTELNDMYFATIRNLALYDYNAIGAEFEASHNENSISRSWVSRDKIVSSIIPIAKMN